MNTTSPKSSLAKLGLHTKQRPIRIMVVGTRGIGKTGKQMQFILLKAYGRNHFSTKTKNKKI